LLEAAQAVFEDVGFLEARISDIAERAGLSHGSFYHYFDSKEQIFREVASIVDERLSQPMDLVLAHSSDTPRDRLHRAIRAHLERYRDEARMMGVIEQVSRYDEHVRAVRAEWNVRYREIVADSIRRLQRRRMADTRLDPLVAAAALGAMSSRFAETWLVEKSIDCTMDEAVDQLTMLFVNAMGIPDAPAPAAPRRPKR
jgi:AcrR family transcriptional regulator